MVALSVGHQTLIVPVGWVEGVVLGFGVGVIVGVGVAVTTGVVLGLGVTVGLGLGVVVGVAVGASVGEAVSLTVKVRALSCQYLKPFQLALNTPTLMTKLPTEAGVQLNW